MCQNEARKKETVVKISNAIVGASLSVVACSATALSLGNSRGAVVLGAPIDLTFEVIPDAGSDVASSCVSAKLVSGANPISESRVQVSTVEGGRTPMVRVRANVAADEPVLTATLTAGCSGQTTRTYTFLADLPGAVVAASRPVDIAQLSSAASATASTAAGSGRAADGRSMGRSNAATRPPVAPRSARPRNESGQPAATRASAATTAPAPTRSGAASTAVPAEEPKARLVMEPLEVWLESPVALRSAGELSALPDQANDAQRAEAAAMWKALNASPEEVRDAVTQSGKLQADLAAQRAQVNAERASAADLKQRLETVESQSFSSTVVYGLVALLLLALALVVWIWSRARRSVVETWQTSVAVSAEAQERGGVIMEGPDGTGELHTAPQPADAWDRPSRAAVLAVAPPPPVARPAAVVQAPRTTMPAELAATAPTSIPELTEAFIPDPAPVVAFAVPKHIVHPEELFDIQQQAEFFVSVGEHDQAIGVLQKHIADHGNTSPYAYLELLRLFHTLSRAESFQRLRGQFQQHFNAQVPEFSVFHRMGRTLEDYPEALAAIEMQWSTTEVMGLIESFIFRKPGEAHTAPFDMAAYDDLLLLLAIAQTTPASQRGAPPPRTRTTPLAAGSSLATPAAISRINPVAAAVATSNVQPDAVDSMPSLFDSGDLSMMPFGEEFSAPPPEKRPLASKALEAPSLDSLMGGLSLESLPAPLAARPISEAMLDLDLSDPPPLTISDLPPVPVTAPPSPDQPVGFGMSSDKLEVRLELQEINKRKPEDV